MAKRTTGFQFEQALSALEALVEKLESGELSLEESLTHFERGIALTGPARSPWPKPNSGSKS